MDHFTRTYLGTALWAEVDDNGDPLDATYEIEDFDDSAIAQAEVECAAFLRGHGGAIEGREDQAAHDLWLTRNHHGAGFWDGDWPESMCTRLTDAAHALGEVYIYVGDDNKLYMS